MFHKGIIVLQCVSCFFDIAHLPRTVEEDAGYLVIPVLRSGGQWGQVSAQYVSRGLSATPDLDYFLSNGSVTFSHGQDASLINITIVDDEDR